MEQSKIGGKEMKILSIDPGETCGYIVYEDGVVQEWGEVPAELINRIIEEVAEIKKLNLVIFEDFVLYSFTSRSLIGSRLKTSETIGVIDYVCKNLEIPIFRSQAQRTKPFNDLKKWNLYLPSAHVRSALKHLLCFLAQYKGVRPRDVKIRDII